MIAHIAPNIRMSRNTTWFDYQVDESMLPIQKGTLVEIPFRNKLITGVVLDSSKKTSQKYELKKIQTVFPYHAAYNWYANFIPQFSKFYSIGYAHTTMLCLPQKPQRTVAYKPYLPIKPLFQTTPRTTTIIHPHNTIKTKHALYTYTNSTDRLSFLDTRIRHALETKTSCVIFFPTQDALARYYYSLPEKIKNQVHVISSGMNKTQIWKTWTTCHTSSVYLVTRIAAFWPFAPSTTYIIDQAERLEYKQTDQNPRYSLSDILALRSTLQPDCTIVYASITPKVEHYSNVQKKSWTALKNQKTNIPQPTFRSITDLSSIQEKIDTFLQEIPSNSNIYIHSNRKGSFTSWYCRDCAWRAVCRDDGSFLRAYTRTNQLICSECRHTEDLPALCPTCRGTNLYGSGMGTQNIEHVLQKKFPKTNIIRLDKDTSTLHDIQLHKPTIIIGTEYAMQKIPFSSLDYILIPDADMWLHARHFRSAEYAYQQIRYLQSLLVPTGELLAYTRHHDHPFWDIIIKDYYTFWQQVMKNRKKFKYPPYSILTKVVIPELSDTKAHTKAEQQRNLLLQNLPNNQHTISSITRNTPYHEHKKYYYTVLIKSKSTDLAWLYASMLPGCFIDRNPETV